MCVFVWQKLLLLHSSYFFFFFTAELSFLLIVCDILKYSNN